MANATAYSVMPRIPCPYLTLWKIFINLVLAKRHNVKALGVMSTINSTLPVMPLILTTKRHILPVAQSKARYARRCSMP